MIQEYILDSNILIYLSQGNLKIKKILDKLNREYFFLSTISTLEVLIGEKDPKRQEELRVVLSKFAPLEVKREIAEKAAKWNLKLKKKLKFKDLLIAATAQVEGLTLITADKDFKSLKGLKVKMVNV